MAQLAEYLTILDKYENIAAELVKAASREIDILFLDDDKNDEVRAALRARMRALIKKI
jgi:hypothetical protein